MSFDLSKAVLRPNEGEVLAETRLAMGVQVLEPGGVIPVHLHEGWRN